MFGAVKEKLFAYSSRNIKSKSFMRCGDRVKIVLCTAGRTYGASLSVNGRTYADSFNDEEPYDRLTHVFYVPSEGINEKTELVLRLKKFPFKLATYTNRFLFGMPKYAEEDGLLREYDNGLEAVKTETEKVSDGVEFSHILYNDRESRPVHVFVTQVNPEYASVYIGTPSDGYEGKKVRATIPEMAKAAVRNGHDIVAAVNADFFDIFGDFHPSGLCMKNGRVVANPESKRPFIALMKDGTHTITDLDETPDAVSRINHAAAGLQMIVRDGKIYDYAPLEPFSFVRHPRTSVGIRKDSGIIIAVVDGRIPDYSNGATLVDLAGIMISFGADRAINLDGGGSSAMYTRRGDELFLHSRPADLFRPTAKLIRKDFNSILIETKNRTF